MKRFAKPIMVALILLFLEGCSATRTVKPVDYSQTFSPQKLRHDIKFVSDVVTEVHPAFFDNPALNAAFRNKLSALQSSLRHPLTRGELFTRLAPLIASLRDGHTRLFVPRRAYEDHVDQGALLFPIDLVFVNGKTLVYHDNSTHRTLKPGTQLVSIDNRPVEKVVSSLANMLSGTEQWRLRRLAGNNDRFKALLLLEYGSRASFDISYVLDDRVRHSEIKGIGAKQLRNEEDAAVSANMLEFRMLQNDVALLKVKHFSANTDNFKRILANAFKQIKRNGVDNLIIDVRDNTGGSVGLVAELLSYLTAQPFPLTEKVTVRTSGQFKAKMKQRIPSLLRWLPLQNLDPRGRKIWSAAEGSLVTVPPTRVEPKPDDVRFEGNVYVLTNGGTFSAAAVFAAAFQRENLGLIVGRETGGKNGTMFAQPLYFELPNTGLSLNVSSMIFDLGAVDADGPDTGIEPDVVVDQSVECAIQGSDCVLQRALRWIGKNRSA